MLVISACASGPEVPAASDAGRAEQRREHKKDPADIAESAVPSIVAIVTETGFGTGFVISPDGLIATNLHVVAGQKKILVVLKGAKIPVTEVFGDDPERDLVILRIPARNLSPLPLGDSNAVRPGQSVVAIGHPLGLEHTVSNGLVSAVRDVTPELSVLQISAPIAPGSSGGPLFNDRGEVIGIATAVLVGGQNLNFGVPVNYLKDLLGRPVAMGMEAFATSTAEPSLPKVERKIPKHPTSALKGCKPEAIALIVRSIKSAIEVGAPLYNGGDFASCYHVYAGAALDLERKLGKSCRKPARALAEGRRRAEKLTAPHEQAWAMRDAFDGLLDVIGRWAEEQSATAE
nr:MAG: serine protease [Pseudomonadota bacterium]